MGIDIQIDSLTDCLVNAKTGEECDTEYRLVTKTISKQDAGRLKEEMYMNYFWRGTTVFKG